MTINNFFSRSFFSAAVIAVVLFIACKKEDEKLQSALRSKEYSLNAFNGSGVTGKITFTENTDKSFNILVSLDKSVKDTVHLVHIRNGSIAEPGNIAIPLTSITGTGTAASSQTNNVKQAVLPDSTVKLINYDSLLNYTGYLNVHYSTFRIDSLLSQGAVGKN
ncbi:MAG: hypothetical protein SFU87_00145 [Chitinophagaceae bacterium]|nr:hypothetical protein [Chitinophagaceae bacterium]